MTDYPHIIARLTNDDWAITPPAYQALWSALENHMQHGRTEISSDMAIAIAARQQGSMATKPGNGIAVMDISGVIGKRLSSLESMCGGVSVDAIVNAAESLAADPSIGTIVMNWHSPGGVVTGVPEAFDVLANIATQKTLISYTDTRMCSAAQWLASAATSVYASNTADTGSVGVYNMSVDRSRQLANEGVEIKAIHAGKHKLMGAPFLAMSAEQVAMVQNRVNETHTNFKAAVTKGRKVDPAALEGQTLTGKEAVKAGLIDGNYPSLRSLLAALG